MDYRAVLTAATSCCALFLASCGSEPDAAPDSVEATATVAAEDTPAIEPSDMASGAAAGGVAAALDVEALKEHRDPERLLRYYTNAIRLGDWQAAARAWSLDAQMTPERLEAEFGGDAGPKIAVGKGDTEGAAGSLYYEAPVVIDFADGRESRRGTIVLRRVNDVPGATEEQLDWRIERSSTLPQ
ncbi:hypothetical protein [Novosphingobium album (ex Liu et al. 2023)]|uniref:Lipoprotein n=1 Tax=Novosphingobium album (ex Liu et al. 2023) TaxID=3031130 RepID=A0ABT5WKG2_9SPHN|nr:hypothetical protein [Novosphingobium album (ex Liu et al. 2023)]MDE8650525.1 hypothetical protein [Novosphingobium album (ex Liu et al. 2023)]